MKVCIESRINVDGDWVDITTEHIIEDKLSPAQKVETIKAIIRGLISTKTIVSRIGSFNVDVIPRDARVEPGKGGQIPGPSFTWPTPHCELHREPMAVSNVQKEEGFTHFYCPKRIGEEYCKNRASLVDATGIPKFWEVK